MTDLEIMNLLADVFTNGNADRLLCLLTGDCEYLSEYSDTFIESPKEIIEKLNDVYSNLNDNNRYTFTIEELENILKDYEKGTINFEQEIHLNKYAIVLHQYSKKNPVAVVTIILNKGLVEKITLSCNSNLYKFVFYQDIANNDSVYDLPSTVPPINTQGSIREQLSRSEKIISLEDVPPEERDKIYIWKKADNHLKRWFDDNRYKLIESRTYSDCIGYRCNYNNKEYTFYMFAYGKKQTISLDGEYCAKFKDYEFAKNSTILVVYLNVYKFNCDDGVSYEVYDYAGNEIDFIEIWKLSEANGKSILVYFPKPEIHELSDRLIYYKYHSTAINYDSGAVVSFQSK